MARDYETRQAFNEESRTRAGHHRQPWTANELEFLREMWDGSEETLHDISEILGRTVEACRQRYYYPEGEPVRPLCTRVSAPVWTIGFCSGCGRYTDVKNTVCVDCQS